MGHVDDRYGGFLTLRDLFKEELSISEIARQTGHSRVTVRRYLISQVPPSPQKRSEKPSKLDGHRECIIGRLKEFALSASRIYREIQDMGFTGKYTIVKDFVHEVRPKIDIPAIYRYETKPGVQAQVDWAECGYIEIDGEKRKLYCFTIVLGYSRIRYAEFTLRIDVYTLIQIERTVGFVKRDFFVGGKFTSFTDLNSQLQK